MRKVSDEDRLKLLLEYAQGEKVRSIAPRYGVSHTYPSILAYQVGIRRGASEAECRDAFSLFAHRTAQPEEEAARAVVAEAASAAEIRRLADKGVPRTSIAALLRCNYQQVASVLD